MTLSTQELVPLLPGIVVSIESAGLRWNCALTQGKRTCYVLCFILNKPLYEIHFDQNNHIQAYGSTYQKTEILSSIKKWLQGEELLALYEEFEFIEKQKRALIALETLIIGLYPEITNTVKSQLLNPGLDIYELRYKTQDRSCKITYSDNNIANVDFLWGESTLFQVQTGQFQQLALVIKRWLIDYSLPSDIEEEFHWIDIGKLAKYYEKGQEIEGDFILSWDHMEEWYGEWSNTPSTPKVLELIAQMRKRGYDRTLRAGQSTYTFMVSRSRQHGLREDQPCITFGFDINTGSMVMNIRINGEEKLIYPKIELTPEIDAHLKRLEACNID